MANFEGTERTNYFKVKDLAAFKGVCLKYRMRVVEGKEPGTCAVFPDDTSDDGCFISSRLMDEDEIEAEIEAGTYSDDYEDVNIEDIIAPHLGDGEVCVLVSAGHERQRYVSAYAMAFDSTGECVGVNINNIYELAKKKFGKDVTKAEY